MDQGFYLGRIDGINVIPDDDIPPGFKRTVGYDIFVNAHNYELMRTVSAMGMIVGLGALRELPSNTTCREPASQAD